MKARYPATYAALDRFDRVDRPAFEALGTNRKMAANLSAFVQARKSAADRVRAAFLSETEAVNSPENVELMSVEKIRQAVHATLLGRMLALLP